MGNSSTNPNADVTYPSGNRYVGSMKGSKKHGRGILFWHDGAKYDGDWQDDEMHGVGELSFPNGSCYRGQFSHSNAYGMGTLTTMNRETLEGRWVYQGRTMTPRGPVGKYVFDGDVFDGNAGKRVPYMGTLSLDLTSGLVALPNMQDPMAAVLPYASIVGATAEEGRKILHEAVSGSVPQGKIVETAPTGIAYGYQDPALQPRHPDDHGRVELADPRLWLNSLGISAFGQPHNFNEQTQRDIATQQNQVPAVQQNAQVLFR